MNGTISSKNASMDVPTTAPLVATTTTRRRREVTESLNDYHAGLIALAVIIVLSNLFAIQIYKRHVKIRRNFNNVLLFSLAISDLVVGVVFLPVLIYCERELAKLNTSTKTFRYTCNINFLLGNFCGFSTIFHIIALTVEKYMAVVHPFRRINVSTMGTYKNILTLIWLLAFVLAMIPLEWFFDKPGSTTWHNKFHNYGIFQLVVFFGCSFVILAFCYTRMFIQIHVRLSDRSQTGRVQQVRIRNNRKTILIFLLLFVVFVIGWFPRFLFTLDVEQKLRPLSIKVRDFLVALRFAGAFLNPLLYAFLKNDYKQAVHADLRALASKCPKRLQLRKFMNQASWNQRINNNDIFDQGTFTTGSGAVRLHNIESGRGQSRPYFGSFTSGSAVQQSSNTEHEDADL